VGAGEHLKRDVEAWSLPACAAANLPNFFSVVEMNADVTDTQNAGSREQKQAFPVDAQQNFVFIASVLIIVFGPVLRPDQVRDKKQNQEDQSHIRKTECHKYFLN
jgi:hypothetical protein